ncbi:MAG: hypothetical protein LBO07_01600 [Coriobacteriales bacterium]|jgi:hypothetical protein|nr:hypothetical protein [Coriobacteriales bacterium]
MMVAHKDVMMGDFAEDFDIGSDVRGFDTGLGVRGPDAAFDAGSDVRGFDTRVLDWKTAFSYQSVGYAFTLVWSALVFSTQGFLAPSGGFEFGRLLCFFVSISAFTGVLLIVPRLLKRLQSLGTGIFTRVPLVLMLLGTLAIVFGSLMGSSPLAVLLLVCGSLATGLGSGLLNLSWGVAYARLTPAKTLGATTMAFLMAGFVCFSAVNLPTWCIVVLMLVCPVVSVAILKAHGGGFQSPNPVEDAAPAAPASPPISDVRENDTPHGQSDGRTDGGGGGARSLLAPSGAYL